MEKRENEKRKIDWEPGKKKQTFFFFLRHTWTTLPSFLCLFKKYISPHRTVWPLSHLWPWQGLSASEALCSERLPPRPRRKSSACWDTRPEPSSEALLQTTSKNMASENTKPTWNHRSERQKDLYTISERTLSHAVCWFVCFSHSPTLGPNIRSTQDYLTCITPESSIIKKDHANMASYIVDKA